MLKRLDRLDWEVRDRIDGRLGQWVAEGLRLVGIMAIMYALIWAGAYWASM